MSSRSAKDAVNRDLHTEDADPVPVHHIPAGNILTAVRNEAPPGHIPPGSRTKTPKTPSPKKMDQILQRDMINKRRFLMQQQEADSSAAVAMAAVNASRSSRSTFPSNPLDNTINANANGSHNNNSNSSSIAYATRSQSAVPDHQQQQQQQQVSRFGRLLPASVAANVPFPSIASRMTNLGNRMAGNTARNTRGSDSNGNGNTAATSQQQQQQAARSVAIMHSGSNVINSEHGNNQY